MRVRRKDKVVESIENHLEETKSITPKESSRVEFLNSGSTLLNLAISGSSKGGWARGRVNNVVGDKSCGKSLLSLDLCANTFYTIKKTQSKLYPRIRNVYIVYDNVEGVMDFKLEQMYGKEFVDNVEWIRSGTCEEFGRNYLSRVKNLVKGDFLLYVIDSMDSLISQAGRERMEKSLNSDKDEEASYGTEKAKYLSNKFFGNCCDLMQGKDATLLCVSQVRENLNAGMFGKKHYRVGGKAMDFYTQVVVWLYGGEKLKETINGKKMVYGNSVIAKVEKNKCGIAFRDAEFPILYNNGISYIDDIGSLIKFLNPKATAKQCEQMLDDFYEEGIFSHKKYEEYKLLAEQEWVKTEKKLSERTKRPNKFELLGLRES